MQITKGKIRSPKKVVIYGPEGIGKSTFASKFPDPVFIDTEGSTKELDVRRFPEPSSWTMIKEQVRYVSQNPGCCRTIVIDTADWAEKMAIQSVLDEHGKSGIEDFGYGNGYRYVYEKFGELLNLLNDVIECGVNVVMTAHATLRKFEQPDEMGAYDRYSMKLIDSPKTSISAAVKEWADMVLFANYKTIIVTDSKTKKSKAQGGKRVIYTAHHSCWDAKNRYGLPEELPFEYDSIRVIIEDYSTTSAEKKEESGQNEPDTKPAHRTGNKEPAKASGNRPSEPIQEKSGPVPETASAAGFAAGESSAPPGTLQAVREENPVTEEELDTRIPKALRDLMLKDNIHSWDIENFAEGKGFVPFNTPLWEYEVAAPGIIEGLFVAQWTKVRDQIRQMRKETEIPFE